MPSATSAPDDAMVPTSGMPSSTASCTARDRAPRPRRGPIAPTCLPPSRRNVLTVRPSISASAAVAASLRRPATGVGAGGSGHSLGSSTSDALCPPNPNEFEITGFEPIERALAGHDVEPDVVADALAGSRSAERGRRGSRAARRPLRPRRRRRSCDRARPCCDVTGGGVVAEDLADGLGLGQRR